MHFLVLYLFLADLLGGWLLRILSLVVLVCSWWFLATKTILFSVVPELACVVIEEREEVMAHKHEKLFRTLASKQS